MDECREDEQDEARRRSLEAAADARLAFALLRAGLLPALYPLGIAAICWEGLSGI